MPVIPLDPQLMVIEWVYRAPQRFGVDYQTLRACALVCKAWTPVAQRLLFRRIPNTIGLTSTSTLPVEPLLLTLRANQRLASFVRSIHIDINSESNYLSDAAESLALLGLCADVQHISLNCFSTSSTFTPTLEEHLRALPVSPVFFTLFADVSIANRITSIWPSVHTLKIGGLYGDGLWEYGLHNPILVSVPPNVRSLSVHTDGSVDTDGVPWKFTSDCDLSELRELEMQLPLWRTEFSVNMLLASGVLPQLRFLGVFGCIPTQDALDQLTQLHTLVFTDLYTRAVVLPGSLCNLAYHGLAYSELQPGYRDRTTPHMLDMLGKAPALRRLTMPDGMSDGLRAKFDEVCANRGIEIVTFAGRRSYKRGVDVD
ncbi:hypothetical protein FA95DRAFT_1561978 [Auriscalpium vulgare]|uniref:Uncharacterized protein n=1 Tax=Auriscalpium vulgare TaxID=40419 RepID=A0ACB8RLI4_9AGAM|nr:hypothetical protein FA95DRAFT_1561978 [Auriscalpium vulgare]